MDILIKGLALPRKGDSLMIYVFPSGNVDYKGFHEMETHRTTAIELPPHGRLIEENKAYDSIMEQTANHYIDMDGVDLGLQNAPTVLEATE